MNKTILKSKTFWLQIATFASAFFPPVQAWLASNPVEVIGVLGAINVLCRFVTKGKVSVFSDDGKQGGSVANLLLAVCVAGALMGGLPSCTTVTSPDGTITKTTDKQTIAESTGFVRWIYDVFTLERSRAGEVQPTEVVPTK